MAEDRGAQVVHHALADLVREERLQHAEHAGEDRDADDPARIQRQGAVVAGEDRLENVLEQERRDDSEGRGEDDQSEQSAQPALVGRKERPDAPHVRAPHGRVGGTFGRRV